MASKPGKTGRGVPMTAARRAKLAKLQGEKIRIGYSGEHKDNAKRIQRVRLTKVNLDQSFGMDVEYLIDEFGEILYPKEWRFRCLPPPYYYTVYEKRLATLAPDEKRNRHYIGELIILVENVPERCRSAHLLAWIMFGLENLDPKIVGAKKDVEDAKLELEKNQNRLDKVPFILNQESADAAAERKHMTKVLQAQRVELKEQLKEVERELQRLRGEKGLATLQLERLSTDEKLKLSTWKCKFSNEVDADQAVSFRNWDDVHLAEGERKNAPVASLEELDGEINMRLVRFRRVRHGHGTLIETKPALQIYRGGWKFQQKHGDGTLYTSAGRFTGTFREDVREGQGEMVFANGDVYIGEWGEDSTRKSKAAPIINVDPGRGFDAVMHGKGELRFNDGSIYKGEFCDGAITGKGVWENARTGERMAGNFLDGRLHGEGIRVTAVGSRFEGRFKDGDLHGNGKLTKAKGDVIEGWFERGAVHGRGQLISGSSHLYEGFFDNGLRHGHGSMYFGNVEMGFNDASCKVELRSDYRYDGIWSGGKEQTRGMLATTNPPEEFGKYGEDSERYFYTTNHKSRRADFFSNLLINERKRRAKENKRSLRRRNRDEAERALTNERNVAAYQKKLNKAVKLYKRIQNALRDANMLHAARRDSKGEFEEEAEGRSLFTDERSGGAVSEEEESEDDYEDDYEGTSSDGSMNDRGLSEIDSIEASKYLDFIEMQVGIDDVIENYDTFKAVTPLEFLRQFKPFGVPERSVPQTET